MMQKPRGDLRHAKWLDPQCYESGGCQSLLFKKDREAMRAEIERLRCALRFYASRQHFQIDEDEDFDSVSGEPENWLCSDREGSTTMLEDGTIARLALRGMEMVWTVEGYDGKPSPIPDEVSCLKP